MKEIKIGECIKELRVNKKISQETLADVCGVSMQAVSKWENGQSYPDISILPVLAEYFNVSLDMLLTGDAKNMETEDWFSGEDEQIKELLRGKTKQEILYIVQYRNGEIIDKKIFENEISSKKMKAVTVRFDEEFQKLKNGLQVEIWGNADVEGDINGSVDAGGSVNCQNVNGSVDAGGAVNCEEINGSVDAGGAVNCEEVNGAVSAGGTVQCEEVNGDVSAGGYVTCSDVEGNVTAGGNISCSNVGGDVSAEDTVTCADVEGNITAGGNVTCNDVSGSILAGGTVKRGDVEIRK